MRKILMTLQKYKWWLVLVIVIAAGGSYGYMKYQAQKTPQLPGRPIKVERGDIISLVSATGTISPLNNVVISSKITGLIKKVEVEENQIVKANDILIILDDLKLRAALSQSAARLANAEVNYKRGQRLFTGGGYSAQQLDAAKLEFEVAKGDYETASDSLDDTIIRAPMDGIVIGKPIPAGQTVSPGISNPMVLMNIGDLSVMQISALVDESDIGKIQLGQNVEFTVDAYPNKTFSGKVSLVSNSANIQQNVVYYPVYINVDNPERLLRPTMTARASIHVGERHDVLVVPTLAIRDNKGQRSVQVMKNGQVEQVKVVTGMSSEDMIEVISGIQQGETVLLPQAKANSPGGGSGGMGGASMFRQTPTR